MTRELVDDLSATAGLKPTESDASWWSRFRRMPPPWLHLALFYDAYVLAGGFGQGLALIPGVSITFWPPAGIFIAALLLTQKYSWPWWIAVGCLAELTCNAIWFHNAIAFALIYFSANALVAVTAAGLISRFIGKPFRLETLEEVAAFVVLGAGIAPMISATIIAATDALLGKNPFWTAWPLVWLGDGTGILVSTPLTLVAVQAWRDRTSIPLPRLVEAVVVLVVLLGAGQLSFMGYVPTPYILLPPLLWAAARFQLKGVAAALALIAIMAALFTIHGGGLADQAGPLKAEIVGLQTFLGIAAISSLVVAVLSLQHKQALNRLNDANLDLGTRVIERTAELQAREAQLRHRLAELDSLYAGSPIGLTFVDRDLRYQRINQVLAEINGRSIEAHLGRTIREVVPRLADTLEPIYRSVLDTGQALRGIDITGETQARPGQRRSWLTSFDPVFGPDGRPAGVNVSVVEITERKRAEIALRVSGERYGLALQMGGLAVWDTDMVTGVRRWTPEAMAAFDLELEGGMGRYGGAGDELLARMHPDDRARLADYHRLAAENDVFSTEFRIVRRDGAMRWMAGRGTITERDNEGRPMKAINIMADITERKQAEEALQASEAFSRSVLEASPDCVKVMGPDGTIEFMNGNGLKQLEIDDFSYCRGELWSSMWPEETRQVIARSVASAKGGRGSRFEAFCPTAKGTPKWWDVAVNPVFDAQQRFARIVSVSRDISDRKRHEEHLKLMMNELNHRVKNTLATVQSMASQTLRSSPSLAEARVRFEARLMSLSKAHDVLTREMWDGAPLSDIVERAIMPYGGPKQDRFAVSGPALRISAQMALAFAMTIHELCTNAVKYGALSNDKGKVTIVWSVSGRKKSLPLLKFRWSEKGGPPVAPPTSRGFGTRLIERSLASDLGGSVKITFARTGVVCVITASLGDPGMNIPEAAGN